MKLINFKHDIMFQVYRRRSIMSLTTCKVAAATACVAALSFAAHGNLEVQTEYLDSKRHDPLEMERHLVPYLRDKYDRR